MCLDPLVIWLSFGLRINIYDFSCDLRRLDPTVDDEKINTTLINRAATKQMYFQCQ